MKLAEFYSILILYSESQEDLIYLIKNFKLTSYIQNNKINNYSVIFFLSETSDDPPFTRTHDYDLYYTDNLNDSNFHHLSMKYTYFLTEINSRFNKFNGMSEIKNFGHHDYKELHLSALKLFENFKMPYETIMHLGKEMLYTLRDPIFNKFNSNYEYIHLSFHRN